LQRSVFQGNSLHPDARCNPSLEGHLGLVSLNDIARKSLDNLNDDARVEAETGKIERFFSINSDDFGFFGFG
jgi:hypothetical protein